ncbi:glycosyltransferase [Salinicola halophilus]|uniref:glycosyltransferase n=1 Tax=Salinicola halophilus TaxID=184065 RepID=UPI000DA1F7E6|nr:glycosyltransferase [Salinicola halophilus]
MFLKKIEFLRDSGFVDEKWYAKRYPDVKRSGLDPVLHYVKYGEPWGRQPSPFFDPAYYLKKYPDVRQQASGPLLHYLMHGMREGRKPAPRVSERTVQATRQQSRRAKKKQDQRIKDIVARIYDLEFSRIAVPELEAIACDEMGYPRQLALWELGVWYAAQPGEEMLEKARVALAAYIDSTKDEALQARARRLLSQVHANAGRPAQALTVLAEVPPSLRDDDWTLARINAQPDMTARLGVVNALYAEHGLEPVSLTSAAHTQGFYERLSAHAEPSRASTARVSVIIPVYNAARTLPTALESLLAQSHRDLEILVSDDASTDETVAVAEGYAARDARIKVLRNPVNQGPYAARNHALNHCTGDYVTTHDADDWSHPRKIELQAAQLDANPEVIANLSRQIRLEEDGRIYLRPKSRTFVLMNLSSLMFRRAPVTEALGYWDKVRFAADSEFLARLRVAFGVEAVVTLDGAPLCFQRQVPGSLTSDSAFGYLGFKTGARKEYDEAAAYARRQASTLRYAADSETDGDRFPRPAPMLPDKGVSRTHFDVIIASDFRLPGGTSHSNIEEIKAQRYFGLRTGLLNLPRYDLNPGRKINENIRRLVDGELVSFVVQGETVTCDHLVIRHPPVVQRLQDRIPNVQAKRISVIVNQPPKREYSETGETLYDIPTCHRHIVETFGEGARWYPIGPLVRESLFEHHPQELADIDLAEEDWVNIINVAEWQRPAHTPGGLPIKIGRHSRDQYVKWPESPEVLRTLYPDDDRYQIHVLGGASAPTTVLGQLPANWVVHEFGSIQPAEFLKDVDFYVYYTHSDWIEAFGRVMFEAMAVGVPVIIDPKYRPLFQDAAIYAAPEAVQDTIERLHADPEAYRRQVERSTQFVIDAFGYEAHRERLGVGQTV